MYAPLPNVNKGNFSLEELNDLEVKTLIPAIIYTTLLMICGVLGNTLVLYIYCFRYKPSNHRYFILTLGVCDFITSAVCMPFLIVDELHPFMFSYVLTCKSFRYVTYNTALISIFTLFVIAIERYRKICKPLKCQLTLPLARRILIGIVILTSTIFALPAFFIFGHTSISTGRENISGAACFTDDNFRESYFPVAYNFTLFTIVFLLGTVMVFCYIKIAHQRFLRAKRTTGRRKYKMIENSGNFISEQSENYLHTSAINVLAQEYREQLTDQTTQTNDSVLHKTNTLNKHSISINHSDAEGTIIQSNNIALSAKYSPKVNKNRNGFLNDSKFDDRQNVIKFSNGIPTGLNQTQNLMTTKKNDEFYNNIEESVTKSKKNKKLKPREMFKTRSLTRIYCCERISSICNEIGYTRCTLCLPSSESLTCRTDNDLMNFDNLVSETTCAYKMYQRRRRRSFPDTSVRFLCNHSFDGKEYTWSHDYLDLTLNIADKKADMYTSVDIHKGNNTTIHLNTIKDEKKLAVLNKGNPFIDSVPRPEITQNSLGMDKMACQNDYNNTGACKGYKDGKFGNKTNQRSRKNFVRRNKTKSAKFAKLRENSLITVTKMLFYITLVYFISFIPHLVLMLTLMLDGQFLTSLNQTEASIYYIALRSFLINSVANPFIYNFMDTKFRKECKNLFVRRTVQKRVYSL